MGTWSVDAFGNDEAADWAYELEDALDLRPIHEAIAAVVNAGDEYLEAPEASIALAAIEVLARLGGKPGEHNAYTEVADKWIAETQIKPSIELIDAAQAAITRILADKSELHELWRDSDEYDDWVSSVNNLLARIDE